MESMRSGFTMIELIFSIVIIGILAAVAIPKLSATRDDAINTQILANAQLCKKSIINAFAAEGLGLAASKGAIEACYNRDGSEFVIYDEIDGNGYKAVMRYKLRNNLIEEEKFRYAGSFVIF